MLCMFACPLWFSRLRQPTPKPSGLREFFVSLKVIMSETLPWLSQALVRRSMLVDCFLPYTRCIR